METKSKYFVVGEKNKADLLKEITGIDYYSFNDGYTFPRSKLVERVWKFIQTHNIYNK